MPTKLRAPTARPVVLRPVNRNAGLEAEYRKRLLAVVDEMNASIAYWLTATYKANTPEMVALDASPAQALRDALRRLARRWQRNFDQGADRLAKLFADKSIDYADRSLHKTLRDAGFSVQMKMSPRMNDAYQAVIGEQVGLIRSIAQQNLTQVETLVMQSVQRGRDLGPLTDELSKRFEITRKRAALIARDQNNKATATLTRARQLDLGITQAYWKHSTAGREPRPDHVEAGKENNGRGRLYDLAKGCLISGEYILPGELINCRCTAVPVIPGFDDE